MFHNATEKQNDEYVQRSNSLLMGESLETKLDLRYKNDMKREYRTVRLIFVRTYRYVKWLNLFFRNCGIRSTVGNLNYSRVLYVQCTVFTILGDDLLTIFVYGHLKCTVPVP